MFDDDRWYRRLGDMPGVEFAGSPGVDRRRLRDSEARPYKPAWSDHWVWPEHDGESVSPVTRHRVEELATLTTDDLVTNVSECLELPGRLDDWHYVLQDGVSELWRRRHTDAGALRWCERFALLDLELTRAEPDAFLFDREEPDRGHYSVTAFGVLVRLYRAMDDLPAAVAVARRAELWGNQVLGTAADEMQALLDAGL